MPQSDESPAEVLAEQMIVGFLVAAGLGLVVAWPLMLALGVLHHQWPVVPAWGYWGTYVIYLGASIARGLVR
jgi:hypothetical protein